MNTMNSLMAQVPNDGRIRHLLRSFNLSPALDGKARSVKKLAEEIGLAVTEVALPKGVAGRLVSGDPFSSTGYGIEVNQYQSVEAKRFAVLHELGHFFRHTGNEDPFAEPLYLDRSSSKFYADQKQEQEANEFAVALLFADGALKFASELYGKDEAKLCRHFGVSNKTIRIAMTQFF